MALTRRTEMRSPDPSNNKGVHIAKAFVHQAEFFDALAQVQLPSHVLGVTPSLGTDWDGESAVFIQVVLDDIAVPRSQLLAYTKQISQAIGQRIRPLEDWGVLPYFDFQMESENAKLNEPSWA